MAIAVSATVTTNLQSSLLFLPKPSLSPVTLIRFFPSSPRPSSRARLVVFAGEDLTPEIDIGGGDIGHGGVGGGDFGGGGGKGEGEGEGEEEEKKRGIMSMSQKLTLCYAILVGVGGIMGFMKSGSQKSLAAGGVSSLILYYVYAQLPSNPVFASSLGLGVSAALLAVMGSRFKKSGKIFPAGIVSLVSFVMVGGYFHGIIRSSHA